MLGDVTVEDPCERNYFCLRNLSNELCRESIQFFEYELTFICFGINVLNNHPENKSRSLACHNKLFKPQAFCVLYSSSYQSVHLEVGIY